MSFVGACLCLQKGRFALPVARKQTEIKALFFTQSTILPHNLLAEGSCFHLLRTVAKPQV